MAPHRAQSLFMALLRSCSLAEADRQKLGTKELGHADSLPPPQLFSSACQDILELWTQFGTAFNHRTQYSIFFSVVQLNKSPPQYRHLVLSEVKSKNCGAILDVLVVCWFRFVTLVCIIFSGNNEAVSQLELGRYDRTRRLVFIHKRKYSII